MKSTQQALYVNPSFMPKGKIFVSVPGISMLSFGATNSAFSFNDLFTKRADDSLQINTANVISNLKPLNFFSTELNEEIVGFGIKLSDGYFSFSSTFKMQTNFAYPKDLIQFAFEGNGKSYIGERASLDGISISLNSYVEHAFGYTKEINDKLTVGARLKLISGLANIKTDVNNLGIYTDPTSYAITIDGSAGIQSSNVLALLGDSTTTAAEQKAIEQSAKSSLYNFANKGVGIDLGGTYHINEKLSVNASIIDLGSISWKANVKNYKTNDINFTFDGIDLNEFLNDTTQKPLDRLSDTLQKILNYEENTDKYATSLRTKIYLGANYNLTKNFNAGALIFNEFIGGKYRPGLSLSMNATVKNWLVATLNYSIYNGAFSNVGLGLSMRGGPIQFYIMTDNLLSFVNPLNTRNVHLCGGMCVFIKGKEKKVKDKETEGK